MGVHAWPYRRPLNRIAAESWRTDETTGDPLPSALPAWDYTTDLTLARVVRLDLDGIREDCGFPEDAVLCLSVRYWPSTSRIRRVGFTSSVSLHGKQNVTVIEMVATGENLGGFLTVETTLSLADDIKPDEPFVAHRAGSILWSDQVKVHLEGAAGLLPTAPVSFTEAGLPQGAAWYVSMDGSDWLQAAMGSLLILLNTDNAAICRALASENEETAPLLWDTLGIDIVTDLVGRALDDESFDDDANDTDQDGDLTMAGLVKSLVRTYLSLPTESPSDAMRRLRDERRGDPSRFRAQVQRGVGFPREVSR